MKNDSRRENISIASVVLSVTIIELYLQFKDAFGRKGADAFMQLAFRNIWDERLKRLLHNAVNIAEERITMQSFGQFMERLEQTSK